MNIYTVSITGADDNVKPEDLVDLSNKYPFVEWGLLLSSSREGSKRFPTREWLAKVQGYSDYLRLAGHLCGRWVRELVQGGKCTIRDACPGIWPMFQRMQINFHGNWEHCPEFLDAIHLMRKQIIFQIDSFDNELFIKARKANLDVVPLFDISHGRGWTPETWPKPLTGVRCGFAGGLGSHNIEAELQKIKESASDAEIWLDMESNVRDDDDRFDLEKVERVLDVAEDYITYETRAATYLETDSGVQSARDSFPPHNRA
jgi:hypothetical protein